MFSLCMFFYTSLKVILMNIGEFSITLRVLEEILIKLLGIIFRILYKMHNSQNTSPIL